MVFNTIFACATESWEPTIRNSLLEIYNALRPYRSNKQELLDIAGELDGKYGAKTAASLVREAAEVYEKRGRLKKF